MRRFTTDSGRVPTIASIATQRGVQQESQDYGPSVCNFLIFTAIKCGTISLPLYSPLILLSLHRHIKYHNLSIVLTLNLADFP